MKKLINALAIVAILTVAVLSVSTVVNAAVASGPAPFSGDGIPDGGEQQFKLNPQDPSDGPQDSDKDGYTNLEEYLNGTDPTVFVDYTMHW